MKNLELVPRNLEFMAKEKLAILENDPKFKSRLTTVREEFDRKEEERKENIKEDIEKPEQLEKTEELPKAVDETKFAQIYGKAKGRIQEALGNIKAFFKEHFSIKSNDEQDSGER